MKNRTTLNWKGIVALSLLVVMCITSVSCRKRCRCIKNNMTVDYYTPEELDERGKRCVDMVYLDGLAAKYYSLCEWEY